MGKEDDDEDEDEDDEDDDDNEWEAIAAGALAEKGESEDEDEDEEAAAADGGWEETVVPVADSPAMASPRHGTIWRRLFCFGCNMRVKATPRRPTPTTSLTRISLQLCCSHKSFEKDAREIIGNTPALFELRLLTPLGLLIPCAAARISSFTALYRNFWAY